MKKQILAALLGLGLVSGAGTAQAAVSFNLTNIGVPAEGFAYIPFDWNGDNDGFRIETYNYTLDPELFLLNAAGTSVLYRDDDDGSFLNARIDANLAAGSYWAAIGQYNSTDAEALAGFNPSGAGDSNPAFTVSLYARADDTSGDNKGDFRNVGPVTTTAPGAHGTVPAPATAALLGLGLGVAGFITRRRKA